MAAHSAWLGSAAAAQAALPQYSVPICDPEEMTGVPMYELTSKPSTNPVSKPAIVAASCMAVLFIGGAGLMAFLLTQG